MRRQRAQISRQTPGQHVHDLVQQIDGCGPLAGLIVDGPSELNVMSDVGDMDAETQLTRRQSLDRDRVVEVAGFVRVDGDHRQLSQISPVCQFPLSLLFGALDPGRRLGHSLRAVDDRNAVCESDGVEVVTRILRVPEDAYKPSRL